MRKLALIATLLFSLPAGAAEWDMNKQIDQTNFVVNGGCSGTLIDVRTKYVLTAAHCVEDQYEVVERDNIDTDGVVKKEKVRRIRPGTVKQLFFKGANETHEVTYRTMLMASDKDTDLALLKILSDEIPNSQATKVSCQAPPKRGDTVFVVGNPHGTLYSSVVKGIVSSVQRDYGLIRFPGSPESNGLVQISAGVIGGNSGGAVYDVDGYLVGVPVLASPMNEILGFAVPLDDVKSFLRKNGTSELFAHCEK